MKQYSDLKVKHLGSATAATAAPQIKTCKPQPCENLKLVSKACGVSNTTPSPQSLEMTRK